MSLRIGTKVVQNPCDRARLNRVPDLNGWVGIVVDYDEYYSQYTVDFGRVHGYYTHDCNGRLPEETGRYYSIEELIDISSKFKPDKEYEDLYD